MASLNKITLIGHAGQEPEMRFTPDDRPVTNFSLATNQSYTKADGEKVDKTLWFRVTCWNRLAETVNQYLSKGKQVYVEGRIELQEYERQDGSSGAALAVTANTVLFLGRKEDTVDDGSADATLGEVDLDDLPF